MKYLESKFKNLAFGNLSEVTIAKFNDLPSELHLIPDADIEAAHNGNIEIRLAARQEEDNQAEHIRENARRKHDEVILSRNGSSYHFPRTPLPIKS